VIVTVPEAVNTQFVGVGVSVNVNV
jgi:hypothetical protein